MLEQVQLYNDLSPKLRKELEKQVDDLGKTARFKFNISHPNPDRQNYNGTEVWPFTYTLDPVTFTIQDTYEDRPDKQKQKRIGMVDKVDAKGIPEKFNRIRVHERQKGELNFNLENEEERTQVAFLLLHPKLQGGKFSNKNTPQVFYLIDDVKVAKESRSKRTIKRKAMDAAIEMSDADIKQFADAMSWPESNDADYLRNKVEEMAETSPELFNDLIAGKTVEYQATVKRALDNKIISFDPVDFKYIWASNTQVITVLGDNGSIKNEVERFAEWLMTAGSKADEVYKKIKSLLKKEAAAI